MASPEMVGQGEEIMAQSVKFCLVTRRLALLSDGVSIALFELGDNGFEQYPVAGVMGDLETWLGGPSRAAIEEHLNLSHEEATKSFDLRCRANQALHLVLNGIDERIDDVGCTESLRHVENLLLDTRVQVWLIRALRSMPQPAHLKIPTQNQFTRTQEVLRLAIHHWAA